MGNMDPSGSIFRIVEQLVWAPGRAEGTGKRGWPELGRSKHLETRLDLTAEGGHAVMCCRVHLGTVPPEIRKKSKLQTGNWVKKILT